MERMDSSKSLRLTDLFISPFLHLLLIFIFISGFWLPAPGSLGLPVYAGDPSPYVPRTQDVAVPSPIELPAPLESQNVPNRPLTAEEAAHIALANQPGVTIAQSDVESSEGRLRQSVSLLSPTVSVSAGYTGTAGGQGGSGAGAAGFTSAGGQILPGSSFGAFSGYQTNLTVSQLIFDFNHTRDTVREAQAIGRSAAYGLTKVQLDLVFDVKKAFYTFVQDSRLVTVNESNVDLQGQHLKLAEERYIAGVGLPSDVVRAKTALSESIYDLTEARAKALVSRVNLATLMGIDPRTPILASDEPEPENNMVSVEEIFEKALEQRPEILKARSDMEASQYSLNAAFTTNAPELSTQSGWFSRGSTLISDSHFFNASLLLRMSLYDGGMTAGLVQEARAKKKAADAGLALARETVLSEAASGYLSYVTAKQKMEAAEAEVANAEESHRLVEGRYKAGVGLFLEVLDAQSALLQARTNRVNARSAFDIAKASIAHALGKGIF